MSRSYRKKPTSSSVFLNHSHLEMQQCQGCNNFSGANLMTCPYCQSPRLTQVIITENGQLLPLHTSLRHSARFSLNRFLNKLLPSKNPTYLLN